MNQDGYIDQRDMRVFGNALPKFQFGLGQDLTFKGWEIQVFFRSVLGHHLINSFGAMYEAPDMITTYNLPVTAGDRRNSTTGKLMTGYAHYSNIDIENASFISRDNASVAYNFRPSLDRGFSRIRLYLAGNDLFYLTKYKGSDPNPRYTDYDPNGGTYYNPLVAGINRRHSWCRTRSVTLGIDLALGISTTNFESFYINFSVYDNKNLARMDYPGKCTGV